MINVLSHQTSILSSKDISTQFSYANTSLALARATFLTSVNNTIAATITVMEVSLSTDLDKGKILP